MQIFREWQVYIARTWNNPIITTRIFFHSLFSRIAPIVVLNTSASECIFGFVSVFISRRYCSVLLLRSWKRAQAAILVSAKRGWKRCCSYCVCKNGGYGQIRRSFHSLSGFISSRHVFFWAGRYNRWVILRTTVTACRSNMFHISCLRFSFYENTW